MAMVHRDKPLFVPQAPADFSTLHQCGEPSPYRGVLGVGACGGQCASLAKAMHIDCL